ncbi:DUF1800 family protein [Aquincola tertiaricarbonis]|uniref:DUF1800 family protein n=1 Tax=Aquincola tertiaricarbonis TaxID=391953 RepID=A0ABY4S816_AQUTE|nr:DUF1800 family protein [Aquincola tertiaricarbonis]URI09503.1 DUF1800 family protein [Aquincola tertiaricarbonis]
MNLPRPASLTTKASSFALILAFCAMSTWAQTNTLVVRAKGDPAGGVAPQMVVRIDGATIGAQDVSSREYANYSFAIGAIASNAKIDIVFTNDASVGAEDRNLYVAYIQSGTTTVLSNAKGVTYDRGSGTAAFDGVDVVPGQPNMYWGGALRFTWPIDQAAAARSRQREVSRFLQQATFGPTPTEINRLSAMTYDQWLAEQANLPPSTGYVDYVQSKYDLGNSYRPGGANYSPGLINQRFWRLAATAPDQLRQRMAFALHKILMVSQEDAAVAPHARAFAAYMDTITKNSLGNYRTLLEDVALSPAMGLYLSSIRNRKEDPSTNRLPDENFARELMQLFTIGLYELNTDGSRKLDGQGKPIETYTNADVMALAKVFTGWSWAFPDTQLNESNFRWLSPNYAMGQDTRVDTLPMRAYPGLHSLTEKRLFVGKPHAVTIPAGGTAEQDLKLALDTLFKHPNVAPFISRQLIQSLTTSNPSPAYIARVAAIFNNNGKGVRGDLQAVARAILTDAEARSTSSPDFGKLSEPVLRVTRWMRAFGAKSSSGEYQMAGELATLGQRPMSSPSVFSYFRPGYTPPTSVLAKTSATAPEFQIVNEATTAYWINLAEALTVVGLGSNGSNRDVTAPLDTLVKYPAAGDYTGLIEYLDTNLLAGRATSRLKKDMFDAMLSVAGTDTPSNLNRVRIAVYLALASQEFLIER